MEQREGNSSFDLSEPQRDFTHILVLRYLAEITFSERWGSSSQLTPLHFIKSKHESLPRLYLKSFSFSNALDAAKKEERL